MAEKITLPGGRSMIAVTVEELNVAVDKAFDVPPGTPIDAEGVRAGFCRGVREKAIEHEPITTTSPAPLPGKAPDSDGPHEMT